MFYELDQKVAADTRGNNPELDRHTHHQIIWIRCGSATHFLDGEIFEFPKHSIVCIPKGSIHHPYPSRNCKISVIRFREEFLESALHPILSLCGGHKAIRMNNEQASIIESYLELIAYECAQSNPYLVKKLQNLLTVLILKIEEQHRMQLKLEPRNATLTQCIWNRFNSILEEKFRTEHLVSYYALKMGLSSRKLGEIIMYYTGRYVSDVINDRLILEARRMLLVTDFSIKEIAFELGFQDNSYFAKVFKKLTGVTPTEFKPANIDALFYDSVA